MKNAKQIREISPIPERKSEHEDFGTPAEIGSTASANSAVRMNLSSSTQAILKRVYKNYQGSNSRKSSENSTPNLIGIEEDMYRQKSQKVDHLIPINEIESSAQSSNSQKDTPVLKESPSKKQPLILPKAPSGEDPMSILSSTTLGLLNNLRKQGKLDVKNSAKHSPLTQILSQKPSIRSE